MFIPGQFLCQIDHGFKCLPTGSCHLHTIAVRFSVFDQDYFGRADLECLNFVYRLNGLDSGNIRILPVNLEMKFGKEVIAIIFIVIGATLLLDNLNIIPGLPSYLFSWPALLIIIGVFSFLNGNRTGAVIMIGTGGFFLIQRISSYYFDLKLYWPVILVIVGLAFLFRYRGPRVVSGSLEDSYFDDINIFSGGNKRITSKELKGGKVTNIFGGSEIDLTEAIPVEGAVIEVITLFGGCKLIVPAHWKVSISTTAVFGGFEDNRDTGIAKSGNIIYIKGITMFGGGELSSRR